MASSHFGLSRVPRPSNETETPEEGPGVGSYPQPPALVAKLPGFTPFGSSGKRTLPGGDQKYSGEEPGPGNYDLTIDYSKGGPSTTSGAGGALKSKTERWQRHNPRHDNNVGPQSYILPSTVKSGRKKKFSRPGENNGLDLMDALRSSVPSIPTRHQATGYESNDTGMLVLQDAVEPGFDGTKYNSVGPGDYEPKMDFVKYRHAPKVNMKGSDRNQIYRQIEKAGGQAPGPGYYNQRGDFDRFDDSDQTNYLVRLNAAKTKLSASFASGTSRNAMLNAELKPKIGNPGPGAYSLRMEDPVVDPSSPVKKTDQNFLSGGERFPKEKNSKNNSAPNKVALKSDFDLTKMRILRQKKLKARSGWAQNIAFDGTERRFFKATRQEMVVPPPGAYTPKNDFSNAIKKGNPRAPGFNSSTGRDFEASRANQKFTTAQDELMRELEDDLRGGVGPGGRSANRAGTPHGGMSADGSSRGRDRPSGIGTAFGAGAKDSRFGKSLEPVGPPPGAYNTIKSWSGNCSVKMSGSGVIVRKPTEEIRPGPGDYVLPSTMPIPKAARSQVMVSSAKRQGVSDGPVQGTSGPGPGSYDTAEILIRKSHNILLAPEY